jgi:hypothetical protein
VLSISFSGSHGVASSEFRVYAVSLREYLTASSNHTSATRGFCRFSNLVKFFLPLFWLPLTANGSH